MPVQTSLEYLKISSPGVDKRLMFGIEELRLTNTYDADGVLVGEPGDILQNTTPPISLACLDAAGDAVVGISFGDIIINTAAVTIAGTVYPAGQAVLGTVTAQAGITPQWAKVFCDWTSVAGQALAGWKWLRIDDAMEMR